MQKSYSPYNSAAKIFTPNKNNYCHWAKLVWLVDVNTAHNFKTMLMSCRNNVIFQIISNHT
jgi:hypothetical protein